MQPIGAGRYGKGFTGVASAFVTVSGGNVSHSTYIMAAESHSLSWIQFHLQLVFFKMDVASEFVVVSSLYNLPENEINSMLKVLFKRGPISLLLLVEHIYPAFLNTLA